jgi:hypothetical protein
MSLGGETVGRQWTLTAINAIEGERPGGREREGRAAVSGSDVTRTSSARVGARTSSVGRPDAAARGARARLAARPGEGEERSRG